MLDEYFKRNIVISICWSLLTNGIVNVKPGFPSGGKEEYNIKIMHYNKILVSLMNYNQHLFLCHFHKENQAIVPPLEWTPMEK